MFSPHSHHKSAPQSWHMLETLHNLFSQRPTSGRIIYFIKMMMSVPIIVRAVRFVQVDAFQATHSSPCGMQRRILPTDVPINPFIW